MPRKPAVNKPAVKKSASPKASQRKPTLSPTKIATYLECAIKYRFIYLDKMGRFYSRARAYYSFGSTLHHVLQEFHKQGATHTAEELAEELAQRWVGAGYETEEQEQAHRETGQQIVQAYQAAHQERSEAQREPAETVATEKTLSYDVGPFRLSGRVDRIDRHIDGRLEIIDYKSGRWDVTPEEVANDLAMSCYQLILKRQHPDTPVCATIYCLRSGLSATAEWSDTDLAEFERDLRTLGAEILENDYSALRPVRLAICPDCDFLPLCARFWREEDSMDPGDRPPSDEGL